MAAKNASISHAEQRRRLEEDVAKFLKQGNKVEEIPTGVSGQDPTASRKHLILNPRRKSG